MEKIKNVVTSPLLVSAMAAVTCGLLIIKGDIFYSGLAAGVAICQFLQAFKTV